jgi:predicted dehydrogenase
VTLKVAIVGCGKIADGHVEEIQKLAPRARVVAACDRELVMAEQLAVRYGIPATYADASVMLMKERPDVVHVTTPPGAHLALARQCVDSGAHVFVEKPLTLTYAESEELVEYVAAAGKKLTIGYSYHFEPPMNQLRDLLARGELGEPVHVETFYGYNLEGAFGKALLADPNHWVHALPGKLFHNTIDHALAKLIDFIPDDRPEIHAFGSVRRTKRYGDARDSLMDELRVVIRGARTSAYLTFSAGARPVGHFARVYGTKNTAHADFNNRTVALDKAPTLPSAVGRLVPAFESAAQYLREGTRNLSRFAGSRFHFFAGLGELVSRFYASIETNAPLPIAPRDILRVAWMMDEIFDQVDQHDRRAGQRASADGAVRSEASSPPSPLHFLEGTDASRKEVVS